MVSDAMVEAAGCALYGADTWQILKDVGQTRAKEIRAALEAAERAAWRPIATAPRNGTFMLCALESGHQLILQFHAGYWRRNTEDSYQEWRPTHFRPLPQPPVT